MRQETLAHSGRAGWQGAQQRASENHTKKHTHNQPSHERQNAFDLTTLSFWKSNWRRRKDTAKGSRGEGEEEGGNNRKGGEEQRNKENENTKETKGKEFCFIL